MSQNLSKSFRTVAACALVVMPAVAGAGLGANTRSVEADRVELKATVRMLPAPRYTVHELQVPGGTVVREFVSPLGTVFAVAWRGPFMPNLRQTLGVYFDSYQTAARANRSGHSRVSVSQQDLVVFSGGHQRAFFGQAYLPQALPAGVTADELR
jgi:Protein of unknown function (DUF2844)